MPEEGPILNPTRSVLEAGRKIIERANFKWRDPWLRARRPVVQQYLLNHAFVNGNQYCRHDGTNLKPIPRKYKNQVRLVNNLMRPAARIMLSQLTQNRPLLDLRTVNPDHESEAQTIVGRELLKGIQHATRRKKIDRRLWYNLMKGGTACKRIGYNFERGPVEEIPAEDEDGNQLFQDLDDRKLRTENEVREILGDMIENNPDIPEEELFGQRFQILMVPERAGEITVDVYTCLEHVTDPSVWDLRDEAQIVFTARAHTLDFIRKKWPERGKFVQPENNAIILFDEMGGGQMLPGVGIPRTTGRSDNLERNQQDVAVVWEMQIKPTESNPLLDETDNNGRTTRRGPAAPLGVHFVYANGVPLTDPDNPLPYAIAPEIEDHDVDFDLVDYHWFPEEGYWSSNFFSDVVPLQMSFNRRRSQFNETLNAYSHPKTLVPMGSRVKRGSFADVAGEIIEYAGTPPSYLEPPRFQPGLLRGMDMDVQQFNDVTLLHEVTRQGKVPPQTRTASALMRLQEIDEMALKMHVDLFEESEAITGQKMLDRAKQFYEDERIIRFVGERHRLETRMFKRKPFFQHRWEVIVHEGSALPESRAAKQQQALELLQFAPMMFVDQQGKFAKDVFARLVGLDDFDEFIQDHDESRQAAEYENAQMDDGVEILPRPYEEDAIHLRSHYAVIRSPDFREKDVEIQRLYLEHASAHEQQMGQKMRSQGQVAAQMAQEAARGAEAVARQSGAEAAAASARGAAEAAVEREVQERFGGGGSRDGQQASPDLLRQLANFTSREA